MSSKSCGAGDFFSFYLYCLSSERTVGFYLLCMVCYFLVRYFINILFSAKVQNRFRTVNCHYFKSDSVYSGVSDMLRLWLNCIAWLIMYIRVIQLSLLCGWCFFGLSAAFLYNESPHSSAGKCAAVDAPVEQPEKVTNR